MNTPKTVSVDDEIYSCLRLDTPKSFFLFAGAGSGKTRSLVNVLQRFRDDNGSRLRLNGQKVAIITYTNAACNEIIHRLEFDNIFVVSTIHSFAWELIKPFQKDIREWVRTSLKSEIIDLEEKQRNGRTGTKANIDRERQLVSKNKRLEDLDRIKSFSYNPNGINSGKDSLNHSEVINISASFLSNILMQKILVRKYPILLIDESQDTKKELVDVLFTVQKNHSDKFVLGLFGDTMQRIYMDGKMDLGKDLPDEWAKPSKKINYRCPKRVITLINRIRFDADRQSQEYVDSNKVGNVRLFIINANSGIDKFALEDHIAEQMAEITGDCLWTTAEEVKVLTLEHHMAARRGGFIDFFEPLYSVDKISTGLLDGTLSGVSFFTQQILPLVKAKQKGDEFGVAQVVRKYSAILNKNVLKESPNPLEEIKRANYAVTNLISLWSEKKEPSLVEILQCVARHELFPIPDVFASIAYRTPEEQITTENDNESDRDEITDAWDAALKSPFSQLEAYNDYISDKSRFGTHQGVKGLEFPRVMVILDDEQARGFLFSYEKLFGAKELSETDRKNIAERKETSIDRTRRLFYVTCSRAKESLAIIAYTKNPDEVKKHAIVQGWFEENEIMIF